jgi:hypothetical protein
MGSPPAKRDRRSALVDGIAANSSKVMEKRDAKPKECTKKVGTVPQTLLLIRKCSLNSEKKKGAALRSCDR